MNNLKVKNVRLGIDRKTTLPNRDGSGISLKANQIIYTSINNAFQKMTDNDLFNERLAVVRRGYADGPNLSGGDENLATRENGYKVFGGLGESQLSILQKYDIPLSDPSTLSSSAGLENLQVNFVFEYKSRYIVGTSDGLYASGQNFDLSRFDRTDGNGNRIFGSLGGTNVFCYYINDDYGNRIESDNWLNGCEYYIGTDGGLYGLRDNGDTLSWNLLVDGIQVTKIDVIDGEMFLLNDRGENTGLSSFDGENLRRERDVTSASDIMHIGSQPEENRIVVGGYDRIQQSYGEYNPLNQDVVADFTKIGVAIHDVTEDNSALYIGTSGGLYECTNGNVGPEIVPSSSGMNVSRVMAFMDEIVGADSEYFPILCGTDAGLYVRNRLEMTFEKIQSGISDLDNGKIADISARGAFIFAAVEGNSVYYANVNSIGKWYRLSNGTNPTCFDREEDFDTDYSGGLHVGRNDGVDEYLIRESMMLIPNDSTVDSRLNSNTLRMMKNDVGRTLVSFDDNPILYQVVGGKLEQLFQFPDVSTRINDVATIMTAQESETEDVVSTTPMYVATNSGVAVLDGGLATYIQGVGGCDVVASFGNHAYAYGGKYVYLMTGRRMMSRFEFDDEVTAAYAMANSLLVISGGVLRSLGNVGDYQIVSNPEYESLLGSGFGNVSQVHYFGSGVCCIRNAAGSGNWTQIDPKTGGVVNTFGGLTSRSLKCACTSIPGEIPQNYIGTDSGYYEIDATLEYVDGPYLGGRQVNDMADLSASNGLVKLIGASDGLYTATTAVYFEDSFSNDDDATVGGTGIFASTYPTDVSCDSNIMMIYSKGGEYHVATGIVDDPEAEDRYSFKTHKMGSISSSETIRRVIRTGAKSALVLTSGGIRTTNDLIDYPWWQTSQNNLKDTVDLAIRDPYALDTLTGSYVIRKSGTTYSLNRINYQTSEALILSSKTELRRVGIAGSKLLVLSGDALMEYPGLPTTGVVLTSFNRLSPELGVGVNDFAVDGNYVYVATEKGFCKYSFSGSLQGKWREDLNAEEIFTEGGIFFKGNNRGAFGVYKIDGANIETIYQDLDKTRYDRTNGVFLAQSQVKLVNGNENKVVNLVLDATGIDERPMKCQFVMFSSDPKKDSALGTKNVTSIAVTDSAAYCVADGAVYTCPAISNFKGTYRWTDITPSGVSGIRRIYANSGTLIAFTDTEYVNINIGSDYKILSRRSLGGIVQTGKVSDVIVDGGHVVFVPTTGGIYQLNPSIQLDLTHSDIIDDCHSIATVGSWVVVLNYADGKNYITQVQEGDGDNRDVMVTRRWYECDIPVDSKMTRITRSGSGVFLDDGSNCVYSNDISIPVTEEVGKLPFTSATDSHLTIRRTTSGGGTLFVASDRTYKPEFTSIPKYLNTHITGTKVLGLEHFKDDGGNDSVLALTESGVVNVSDGSVFYGGNFSVFRSTYIVNPENNFGIQTLLAVSDDGCIFNTQQNGEWIGFRFGNETTGDDISNIVQYDNDSVVYVVGQFVVKTGEIGRVRHFGGCRNELENLNNLASEADGGYHFLKIDDANFLIGYYGGFKFFRDNVVIRSYYNTSYGVRINLPVTAIGSGNNTATDGKSYYVNQGTRIFETNDLIGFNPIIETLPESLRINQILNVGDRDFIIPTSRGLYYTKSIYELRDDINTQSFKEFNRWIQDFYDHAEAHHIAETHRDEDFIQKIAKHADTSMTNVTLPPKYANVPQSIEFNDEYQYIRGGVRNFFTQKKAAKEVYSGGFANRMNDTDIGTLDTFKLDYIVKRWNNGKMEFFIHVPTTMTYYMNHVAGFGNCRYEDTTVERKNIDGTVTDNKLNEKYTRLRIYIDQSHFNLKSITAIQINGTSLPLKVYADTDHPCSGFDGMYHSVIQPSLTMTIPIEQDGNNVERLIEKDSNNIVLEFAVYGTDEQSIRFIAQAYPTATIRFVNNQDLGGEMPDQVVSLGYDVPYFEIRRNMFTKDGYLFKGWTTDPESSTVMYPDMGHIEPTSDDDISLTLYPIFEKYNWDDFTRITYAKPIDGGETVTINKVSSIDDQNTTIIMTNEV